MSESTTEIYLSSGNVFEDLGLPLPDEALAKADLAIQIRSIAKHRHITQAQTAELLGTTQPKVSDLFAGKLAGFSMERLIKYLMLLNRDVALIVTPKTKSSERATFRVIKSDSIPARSARAGSKVAAVGRVDYELDDNCALEG